MYTHIVFVTLLFEFTLVYLLYVLFVLKVETNFEKRQNQPKIVKRMLFYVI